MKNTRLVHIAVLIGLMLYALAGVPLATFHGDEAMLTYGSRDYAVAFIEGNPAALTTQPPYAIDSDPHLRILNGSVLRYTIGLAWQLAGEGVPQLPAPGWDWGLPYAVNVETGHRLTPSQLFASRLPSALMFAFSIPVFYLLAGVVLRRSDAQISTAVLWIQLGITALYALHPALLLNARRAMQEGPLFLFGLLTLLTAAVISDRRARGEPVPVYLWVGLALSAAITLASKHSGAVFILGAFGCVFGTEIIRVVLRQAGVRALIGTGARLFAAGVAAILLFIAFSPALWNDPVARLRDLLAVRTELLTIQAAAQPNGGMSGTERRSIIITQPFLQPLAHYEVASWGEDPTIAAEEAAYMNSPLSGLHFGTSPVSIVIGVVLTLFALAGVTTAVGKLFTRSTPLADRVMMAGLLVWLLVVVLSLLTNPLPWQRYYLPLVPIAVLLIGVSLTDILARATRAARTSEHPRTAEQSAEAG